MWISYNIFKDRANYASIDDREHILDFYTEGRPWMKTKTMEKDFCGSMTADSLILLQAMFPTKRFIWAFGDDNFATFHTWDRVQHKVNGVAVPDWQFMMHNFPIAVLHRPGSRRDAQKSIAAHQFAHLQVKDPRELGQNSNGWTFLKNKPMNVCSTQIRKALRRHHHNIPGLIPKAEDFIYERGLFLDFNTVAAPQPVLKTVPLQTFTTLAATANLVKSTMIRAGGFKPEEFIAHAAACWDKSRNKGDFEKSSEVPGEIADNLISLYWLADLQGVHLPLVAPGHETQDSVSRWCDAHYSGEDLKQRAKNCFEELAELCVCEGMEKDRMVNLLTLILDGPDADTLESACAKTLERLHDYATVLDLDPQTILDKKMQLNRARITEQSLQRQMAKIHSLKDGPS